MKRPARHHAQLFLAALLALVALPASAQVVTTDPAFPTEDQPVTITFDATAGTGGLAGYTGDVYAHTGVTTNLSNPSSGCGGVDWRYVKTEWGENTPATRLTRIADDQYQLAIDDIRSYYGVPASEEIEQLAFVFRSATQVGGQYLEGKATGGCDIFVELYASAASARFAEPVAGPLHPILAERDTTIQVVGVGGVAEGALAALRLLVDETEVAQTTDDTLRYDLVLDEPGRVDVQLIAEASGGEVDTAFFYAVRNPDVVDAPRPAGVEDGITYDDDPTQVTLSLFAPYKDYVYVIGDFTDWEVDPAFFMNRQAVTDDSVHYWLTIDGLEPGHEYGFQYLVDGEIRVADPYATKVLDPSNDGFISADTYPDLKPYPDGLTEHMVGVLQTDQALYDWQVDDFERPAPEGLVIYELLLRDFLAAHDYATLIDTLDYLDRLGVSAIELMPVAEFDGNLSWGYNPAFYFAPDKYYGPADDLRRFVDAAHQRGIAVLLDVVYNHATGQSPFIRLWNEGTYGPPTAENPYANTTARHPFNVFYDLNHESTATKYWLDRVNAYWLQEFNVDGFRFDLSKGFTQTNTGSNVAAWGEYDASRVAILKRMADQIWAVDDEAYVILEHFAVPSEDLELVQHGRGAGYPGMMVWHNMNRAYSQSAMGYLDDASFNSSLRDAYPPFWINGMPVGGAITYMESHDEQWLMYRNLAYGPQAGSYDVTDLRVALDRQKLVGAFFFTVPGPKMMWQFGELGYGYGPDGRDCLIGGEGLGECPAGTPGRTAEKPIRWEYREDPLRYKLYKTWAALINLRNEHEVFTSPETDVAMQVGQGVEVRTITLTHPSMDVVIVGNFGLEPLVWSPAFPGEEETLWYEYFTGETRHPLQEEDVVTLVPGELRLYTNADIGTAEPGLITVDADDDPGAEVPRAAALAQNYPNPFNPQTTITYTLDAAGPVRLAVYDVLGREVAVLADGLHRPGTYRVTFDGRQLPSGLYLYRLETTGETFMRTMMLVK